MNVEFLDSRPHESANIATTIMKEVERGLYVEATKIFLTESKIRE